MSTVKRAYVSSHFALELDGEGSMGFLRSTDGGGVSTEVQTYQSGALMDLWRQVGKPKFGDITLQVGMGLGPSFYTWISDFFTRKITRKNGAIVSADFNYKTRARRTFTDALISEVKIPTLDGGSKDAALMTVKIVPEGMSYTTIAEGKGDKISAPPGLGTPNKVWHASNFRFTIDGFAEPLTRVMKIDEFTIKQQILEYPAGHRRSPIRVPGKLEFPNITIYVPEVDAEKVITQATDRLITYKAPTDGGLTASLELLAPDLSTLCTISMTGVDIVSAEPQRLEATAETIAMVKLMIQVEAMKFEYKSGTKTTT